MTDITEENDDDGPAEPPVLEGDGAVGLWKQGRDAWNDWIDAHPGARIDFSGIDFTPHRTKGETLSFAGFHFGDGDVDFEGANFGVGNVSFIGATFGDGNLIFRDATFGDGRVDFNKTNFGKGEVDFFRTTFGDGDVFFFDSVFGEGGVSFLGASVSDFFFAPTELRCLYLRFALFSAKGSAFFNLSTVSEYLEAVSFRDSVFAGSFTLKGALPVPPDLRGTKADHHVDLSDLRAALQRQLPKLSWPPILSRTVPNRKDAVADAARFRRLKEIAEANRDHAAALRFAADENRAKRWHETGWFASVLDMAFSGFSDYGQSIWRPMAGLVVLTTIAAVFYRAITVWGCWADAISLAAGNAVAFLPQSRAVRADAVEALFGPNPSTWIDLAILGQAGLSFVFLFLIGLGLRNRFRL